MVAIYALKDPNSGDIKYVGKTQDTVERLKKHIRDARRDSRKHTPVYQWVNSLVAMGQQPVIEVIEMCSKSCWQESEVRAIAKHRAEGSLLNVAKGGDEPFCSKEQRAVNGRNNARKVHDDPRRKEIWRLKQALGFDLIFFKKNGMAEIHNRIVAKLKIAGNKCPSLFGDYLLLKEM